MSLAGPELTIGDFAGRVGERFEVPVRGHRLLLALETAQELPASGRAGGAFRLEFLGPSEPMLAQGIFPFEFGDDRYELFIVPIARDERGTRYEAIFC